MPVTGLFPWSEPRPRPVVTSFGLSASASSQQASDVVASRGTAPQKPGLGHKALALVSSAWSRTEPAPQKPGLAHVRALALVSSPRSAETCLSLACHYTWHRSVTRRFPANAPKKPVRAHGCARGLVSEVQVRYGTRTKKPGRGPCARGLVSESWSHGGTTSEGCCDVAEAGKAEARHNRPRTWFRPRKPPVVYEWSTM